VKVEYQFRHAAKVECDVGPDVGNQFNGFPVVMTPFKSYQSSPETARNDSSHHLFLVSLRFLYLKINKLKYNSVLCETKY
jgi:hypothetical protein